MKTPKRYLVIDAIALYFVAGCGVLDRPYVVKNYGINEVKEVPVGSVMMAWEYGKYNDITYYKFDGHRIELIYGGVDQNTVTVTFQEFVIDAGFESFTRPTYTQQLTFDLNQSTTISYEDARIQVISVSKTTIRYRVLQGPTKFEEYAKKAKQLFY